MVKSSLSCLLLFLLSSSVFIIPASALAAENELPRDRIAPVLLTEAHIVGLKRAVENQQEPQFSAFQRVMEEADANLERPSNAPSHWHVPGFYVDAEGHKQSKNGLRDDANNAYAMALAYRMTGEQKYADSALRLINSWATEVKTYSLEDDSTLSFSYHFPSMIYAASLLRENVGWQQDEQNNFELFLREKALALNSMDKENNWGNWGLALVASIASYVGDGELLDRAAERWKYFIEHQIAEDGSLPHEVHRNEGRSGMWYSHFSLMPQTLAAEVLKVNGQDLYAYEAPNGRTLESAFRRIALWTEKPESFPYWQGDPARLGGVEAHSYFEILNSLWPESAAVNVLKLRRPMTSGHGAPHLTFTHGKNLD